MASIRPQPSGNSLKRFGFLDTLNSIEALNRLPARIKADYHEALGLAQRFNEEVLLPMYLEVDRKVMEDNEYLPLDFLEKARQWGLFSLWIPKMYGGRGMNMLSLYTFMDELSSVCAGLANLIGAHYLGVSVLCSSCNMKITNYILRDVVRREKRGNPCTISLAWTEPDAGTDQVEAPLLPLAKVRTQAARVDGGYVVNGSKVFISAGHLSAWHMLMCYEDVKKPSESLIMLALKTGMKGFTFGHKEQKMGQKACVASELIFEDCFVPDENVCFSKDQVSRLGITANQAAMKLISMFPAVTQPGVAAIGAGIARAACKAATDYASKKQVAGSRLIDMQWVQLVIADMYANAVAARNIYMEAAYAAGMKSMLRLLFDRVLFYLTLYTPEWMFTLFVSPLFNLEIVSHIYRKLNFEWTSQEDERHMSGLGSLTKFFCTDLAAANCAKA
ncbi:MAG TPA: acyl-CoA dehydrogenase family protein, partial [Deltaproteobacteria bacterium]|nr:acyl-CoA dehydrogenase family protein [Deltaproteobacteria bacterium]